MRDPGVRSGDAQTAGRECSAQFKHGGGEMFRGQIETGKHARAGDLPSPIRGTRGAFEKQIPSAVECSDNCASILERVELLKIKFNNCRMQTHLFPRCKA